MRQLTRWAAGAALAAVLAGAAEAQDRSVRLGILGGATFATFGGDDVEDLDSKVGLTFGGFASFGVSRNLAIETGATFTQRGAKSSSSGVTEKVKLDYVEVPVLLSVRLPGASAVTPFFGAGPAVGFRVGCSFSASGGGTSVGTGCDVVEDALDADLKGTDFGLLGEAGVDVRALRFAIRYYLGLSKIDGASPAIDAKNRAFSFLVGYAFQLR